MIRNKDRIGPDGLHDLARNDASATAVDLHEIAFVDAKFLREQGMHFAQRLRDTGHQRTDSPRLRARKIVGHNTASRENNRIFAIRLLRRWPPFHGMKMGFAIGMLKFIAFVKPRRTRMSGPDMAKDAICSRRCGPT